MCRLFGPPKKGQFDIIMDSLLPPEKHDKHTLKKRKFSEYYSKCLSMVHNRKNTVLYTFLFLTGDWVALKK